MTWTPSEPDHHPPRGWVGDEPNGLTPLLRLPAGTTHEQALAEIEHELE